MSDGLGLCKGRTLECMYARAYLARDASRLATKANEFAEFMMCGMCNGRDLEREERWSYFPWMIKGWS